MGDDKTTVGDITNRTGVAIGRGARATVYQGLTIEQVADLLLELKNKDLPTVWNDRTLYLGLKAFQESDAEFLCPTLGMPI